MPKIFLLVMGAAFLTCGLAVNSNPQTSRTSISSREVNGTYQYNFTGKFKGTSNEIKILALGKGKIKLAFDLTYPYIDATGGLTANVGTLEGIADISGDIATYSSNEFGDCKITITFVKPGTIEATQYGGSACGFGHNVSANGTYKKVTGVKPKI